MRADGILYREGLLEAFVQGSGGTIGEPGRVRTLSLHDYDDKKSNSSYSSS